MAVGNAVGSVTANLGLILGISVVCIPSVVHKQQFRLKALLMAASALLLFLLCRGGRDVYKRQEYGIYAKTVKNNADISEEDKKYIFEQLMANFKGECSEVGMYLCMARIAHR